MALNYGAGPSRVLDPEGRQFLSVVWQQGRPPLDSELTLIGDLAANWDRTMVLRNTPSGWLSNETGLSYDFQTDPTYSNWFRFGRQRQGESQSIMWACVNGWLVPVTGTRTGTPPGSPNDNDTTNVIALDPAPSSAGDFRTDFVFLEVFRARIPPSPLSTNKPAANSIWYLGNVESGHSFLPDDLIDNSLGFETSQRSQLQYRIRVVKGLTALSTSPDGFDPTVKAQGTQVSPPAQGGYSFINMRQTLGDPGLWRAGDGTANALGTVDGYVYAIPLCAVFRRNSAAWAGAPAPNLNGAFNRNPTATDRTGILTFSGTPTVATLLTASATEVILSTVTNIPLPTNPTSPVLVRIGDELMTYTAVDLNNSMPWVPRSPSWQGVLTDCSRTRLRRPTSSTCATP